MLEDLTVFETKIISWLTTTDNLKRYVEDYYPRLLAAEAVDQEGMRFGGTGEAAERLHRRVVDELIATIPKELYTNGIDRDVVNTSAAEIVWDAIYGRASIAKKEVSR